jgi:hypothetical protein
MRHVQLTGGCHVRGPRRPLHELVGGGDGRYRQGSAARRRVRALADVDPDLAAVFVHVLLAGRAPAAAAKAVGEGKRKHGQVELAAFSDRIRGHPFRPFRPFRHTHTKK